MSAKFNLKGLSNKEYTLFGSFAPNGSGTVSSASNRGTGFSVARTSTGLFTVTMDEPWQDLIMATASLQLAAATGQYCQIGVVSSSAKTIQIRVMTTAVGDVAADANNRVNFAFTFRIR